MLSTTRTTKNSTDPRTLDKFAPEERTKSRRSTKPLVIIQANPCPSLCILGVSDGSIPRAVFHPGSPCNDQCQCPGQPPMFLMPDRERKRGGCGKLCCHPLQGYLIRQRRRIRLNQVNLPEARAITLPILGNICPRPDWRRVARKQPLVKGKRGDRWMRVSGTIREIIGLLGRRSRPLPSIRCDDPSETRSTFSAHKIT